jgi:hypothetical protein
VPVIICPKAALIAASSLCDAIISPFSSEVGNAVTAPHAKSESIGRAFKTFLILGDILLQDDDNSFSANINIENFVLRVDAASGKAHQIPVAVIKPLRFYSGKLRENFARITGGSE